MYKIEEIRQLHIEPTTVCNARCPMCARNACGAELVRLPRTSLTLDDVQRIADRDFCQQLTTVDFCGAYGEPVACPDLLEIISYFLESGPHIKINIYTNGGLRTKDWWKRFAQILGSRGQVTFAIDGLGEVNSIHRQDVEFDRVIENVEAFIGAGGRARWEYLAFRHNEHQISEARALSEQLGFVEFSVKRSGRFLEGEYEYVPEASDATLERFPIHDRQGKIAGFLEPARDPALSNRTLAVYQDLVEEHGSLDNLFSATAIRCRVLETSSVFLGATGHVYPCCWIYVQATRPEFGLFPEDADRQVIALVQSTGGQERLDLRSHTLKEIIEGDFFTAVETSWSCGSVSDGRLKVCARACGELFPAYFDQFESEELLPAPLAARK